LVEVRPNLWDKAPGEEYFDELFRVSKRAIIWGGNYFGLPPRKNFVIYYKKNIPDGFCMAQCEYAWTNIPGCSRVFEHFALPDAGRFHPTQKPAALYRWLLRKHAKPGDKILDTHFGSGSIAVACNDMGLGLTASEIDGEYFDLACERIGLAAAQGRLDFGG